MNDHFGLVRYFVYDYETGFKADSNLILNLVSHLNFEEFTYGETIIHEGQIKPNFYFVKENCVTVVFSELDIRLVDLNKYSFFGDYSVLFNCPSEHAYVATN